MRFAVAAASVALVCTAASAKKPMVRPPPRTDPVELAARVEDAIRHRDAGAVQAMLGDPIVYDGLWFPDAACAKRFGTKGTAEKADVRTLAGCLARQKLMVTTRRSGLAGGAIMTFDPGVELELVFKNDRVSYIAGESPRDTTRGLPTLTVQAFEALRLAGTTRLDDELRDKLAAPASAWVSVCLDKTGVATTQVLEAKPASSSDAFLAAIAGWRFRPFEVRKVPTAACALSLLSYPMASAPAIEALPLRSIPNPVVERTYDDDLMDVLDFTGVPISASPQNVPPTLLEQNRIRGSKQIDPDTSTKAEILKAGRTSTVASLKLCVDAKGSVSAVTILKSSGFPAYDAKLLLETRRWAYKPFLVRGTPAPVCTAATFIYRPKP